MVPIIPPHTALIGCVKVEVLCDATFLLTKFGFDFSLEDSSSYLITKFNRPQSGEYGKLKPQLLVAFLLSKIK